MSLDKIIFVTPSISRLAGGMFASVRGLTASLSELRRFDISVFGLADRFASQDRHHWRCGCVEAFAIVGPHSIGFSPGLFRALAASNGNLLHLNGALWRVPALAVSRETKKGAPVVVSPRGMLDPWALKNAACAKRMATMLFAGGLLKRTRCIHSLCEQETAAIRAAGLNNPVCQLPNGVALPDQQTTVGRPAQLHRVPAGRRIMLFLGRLHPKKGLHLFLDAWARTAREHLELLDGWALVIAGWDQGGYEAHLRRMVEELGLKRHVCLIGPCDEDAKGEIFRHVDAFVLPSQSEGLPLAVLEAWSYALPVLMTSACNIPSGFAAGAAVEISRDPVAMADQLRAFLEIGDTERRVMGSRGRDLVERQYTWPKIAAEMCALYEWCLGGGQPPASVITS